MNTLGRKLLSIVLSGAVATGVSAQTFKIGDQAPPLGGKVKWLKGEPVNTYEKGHVYVLDFWATWCGPCIAAMPHLNKVANTYRDRDVSVVGVAIWPQDGMEPTADFVKDQGDEMSYHVAEDINRAAADAYMASAQLVGIPMTMIVDRDGRLAWMGHPMMDVESVLDKILAGDYDLNSVVERQREIARGRALLQQAEKLARDEKWDESFVLIDQVVAIDHKEFGDLSVVKFQYLLGRFNRVEEAYAYGRKMVDTIINNNPVLLENTARFILEGPGFEKRDYDLAHKAAKRAVELTEGAEPAVLDTFAEVCFAMGDVKQAHDVQLKAIAMVTDARVKSDMEKRLADYTAALEKNPG